MRKSKLAILLILCLAVSAAGVQAVAQSFGGAFQRKKIVLVRKLPPTGHIDGSTFAVNVTGPGIPPDVLMNLKSTVESLIVSNDSRLRSVAANEHPDAVVNCQVTSFSEPPAQVNSQPGFSFGKKPAPAQQMTHITGVITATFNAQNLLAKRSIAANTETAKFDQQYPVPPPANASTQTTFTSILSSHIPRMPSASSQNPGQSQEADKPPTPVELKDMLIQNMAFAIASNLVNTSESVSVSLAIGGGLDEANRLMEQKLWTRALEQLETMQPFPQPDQDAYRIYELGVVNEALGYQAEDFTKARKDLQEASIDYGKAIDAKPEEKNFLQPQTRIDTALAHYKTLGDQVAANAQAASVAAAPPAAADVLTNADVIAMVAAKLDEANIIDTIKTASGVNFDLSAHGQIDLAKASVNGRIIAAMKQKARPQ
jgi:hypothetical protein